MEIESRRLHRNKLILRKSDRGMEANRNTVDMMVPEEWVTAMS